MAAMTEDEIDRKVTRAAVAGLVLPAIITARAKIDSGNLPGRNWAAQEAVAYADALLEYLDAS